MTVKICSKCNIEKSLDSFYKRKGGKFDVAAQCMDCTNKYMRNRYNNWPGVKENHRLKEKERRSNPEIRLKAIKASQRFYSSIEGRARTLLNNARKSPTGKILEFSLTLEHILNGIKRGNCAVTNIPFELSNEYQIKTGRTANPFSPSIDRIDSSKGYTNENTRIVIWQYNMAKGELTDKEIFDIFKQALKVNNND